jgi:hypothetical protein
MPPDCAVCHVRIHDGPPRWGSSMAHFKLVQVGPRRPTRRTGHPSGAVWYCWKHAWRGYLRKFTRG